MQIGFSEPFCTHSNKSQCTQKEAKKGLDFLSIPPYFGTTFFQIYVCPQCIFLQLKAKGEALIKLEVFFEFWKDSKRDSILIAKLW